MQQRRTNKTQNITLGAKVMLLGGLVLPLFLIACDEDGADSPLFTDLTPPAIPSGIHTITGDGAVYVRWTPNKEEDLEGYRIWWDGDGDEEFEEIARVGAFEEGVYDYNGTESASDDFLEYEDFLGFEFNGTYNSYAITAFDEAGNESELSWEYAVDVPRPEGYDLVLYDRFLAPEFSGYDLGSLTEAPQNFALVSTDIYYEVDGANVHWLVAPRSRVKIQDFGHTGAAGFDGLDYAPLFGYSGFGRVEAIEGHAYAVEIAGVEGFGSTSHYAKLWIEFIDPASGTVEMWWGFQEVPGERELGNENDDGGVVVTNLEEGAR